MPKPNPSKPSVPPIEPEAKVSPPVAALPVSAAPRPTAPRPNAVSWIDAFPQVEGWWWFYGWRNPMDVRRHDPAMYLVRASIGPTKRMMYTWGSEHIYREAVGRWLPASIPDVPDMSAYKE